jgi:acetyl esterase/lipase
MSAAPITSLRPDEADITIPLPGRDPAAARVYGKRVAAGGPLVLHFHGGTFACGSLDNGRTVARLLASSGAVVVSLAYPLAPQNPFPAGVEVGYAALEWLYKQRVKLAGKAASIYLAGEEAGGNLAAATALISRDRGHPPLAGQILLSPMLDPCTGTASLREATDDAIECRWASGWQAYLRSPKDAMHPYAVPGGSLRLSDLPPTLLLVSEGDAMRDEGLRFANRLREAGVAVTERVMSTASCWPGALFEPPVQNDCACEDAVQQQLRAFFAAGDAQQPG